MSIDWKTKPISQLWGRHVILLQGIQIAVLSALLDPANSVRRLVHVIAVKPPCAPLGQKGRVYARIPVGRTV